MKRNPSAKINALKAVTAKTPAAKGVTEEAATANAECLCRAVKIEIDFRPLGVARSFARQPSRAHGAAYATYVGCWRSRFRVTAGKENISHSRTLKPIRCVTFARNAARLCTTSAATRRRW